MSQTSRRGKIPRQSTAIVMAIYLMLFIIFCVVFDSLLLSPYSSLLCFLSLFTLTCTLRRLRWPFKPNPIQSNSTLNTPSIPTKVTHHKRRNARQVGGRERNKQRKSAPLTPTISRESTHVSESIGEIGNIFSPHTLISLALSISIHSSFLLSSPPPIR